MAFRVEAKEQLGKCKYCGEELGRTGWGGIWCRRKGCVGNPESGPLEEQIKDRSKPWATLKTKNDQ